MKNTFNSRWPLMPMGTGKHGTTQAVPLIEVAGLFAALPIEREATAVK